jgi:hypothetical protein
MSSLQKQKTRRGKCRAGEHPVLRSSPYNIDLPDQQNVFSLIAKESDQRFAQKFA